MRNRLFALSLAVLAASTAPACGQVAPAAAVVSIADARSLSSQAQADINAHEFAHFATLVGALEHALANPDTPQTVKESPAIYVDGDAERLAVRAWLKSSEGEGAAARAPVIIDDPYPEIAWTLGFYYNEVEQTDDAIRVLNVGLERLKNHLQPALSENAPYLRIEMGAALSSAGQWQKAHDVFQTVLTSPDRRPHAQAYRGIGFSLIEMDRLDEAETAFKQALKLEPDSESAQWELEYIADLRRGLPKQGSSSIIEPARKLDE